jgi:hypothetical protein
MRKRQLLIGAALLFFGLVPLLTSVNDPSLRAINIVRLIGSGICFGAAIVALVGTLRLRDK